MALKNGEGDRHCIVICIIFNANLEPNETN